MGSFSISSLEHYAQLRVLTSWPLLLRQGVSGFAPPAGPLDPALRFPQARPAQPPRRVADFSICSLLALGGSERTGEGGRQEELGKGAVAWGATPPGYAWIHCSRFKPPRLAKAKCGGSPGRAPRRPRVPFSVAQIGVLEGSYRQTRYLSSRQVGELAALLGLSETQVKIWFQNRRARERRDFLKDQPTSSSALEGAEPAHAAPLGLAPTPGPGSTRTLPP
ncbi:homeobox protein MSX-1-like isoform X1 [Caretta caretta]|uniref:homeobox protein MSX-1-like isoform X1 n=1 Tax=Caretta caretta TaxID=8467 RepID=UPI002094116E|nr:homeobox protein MSX-1-like [Caretta caretta]